MTTPKELERIKDAAMRKEIQAILDGIDSPPVTRIAPPPLTQAARSSRSKRDAKVDELLSLAHIDGGELTEEKRERLETLIAELELSEKQVDDLRGYVEDKRRAASFAEQADSHKAALDEATANRDEAAGEIDRLQHQLEAQQERYKAAIGHVDKWEREYRHALDDQRRIGGIDRCIDKLLKRAPREPEDDATYRMA